MKVLMTYGATRENIDGVRFITNLSTGATGAALAGAFAAAGLEVTCLCGEAAKAPEGEPRRTLRFAGFADLDGKLRRLLASGGYGAVVHLAAVSDYSVRRVKAGGLWAAPGGGKLPSEAPLMTVELKRNFKILDRLKGYAAAGGKRKPLIIGFKLTAGADGARALAAVKKLASADLVVHNDLRDLGEKRVFGIYRGGARAGSVRGVEALARLLKEEIDAARS